MRDYRWVLLDSGKFAVMWDNDPGYLLCYAARLGLALGYTIRQTEKLGYVL